jgi:hypothetical protein
MRDHHYCRVPLHKFESVPVGDPGMAPDLAELSSKPTRISLYRLGGDMQGQKLEADNYFDSGAHYVPDWTKICCRGLRKIGCRGWLRVMYDRISALLPERINICVSCVRQIWIPNYCD